MAGFVVSPFKNSLSPDFGCRPSTPAVRRSPLVHLVLAGSYRYADGSPKVYGYLPVHHPLSAPIAGSRWLADSATSALADGARLDLVWTIGAQCRLDGEGVLPEALHRPCCPSRNLRLFRCSALMYRHGLRTVEIRVGNVEARPKVSPSVLRCLTPVAPSTPICPTGHRLQSIGRLSKLQNAVLHSRS